MPDIAFKALFSNTTVKNNILIRGFTYYDYSIETHSHDFYEINIVLSGTGIHEIEDCTVPVRAGNVFVIPPDVAHSYHDCKRLDVFHLLLHPDFIRNNALEAENVEGFTLLTEIEPFLRRSVPTPMFLLLSPTELDAVKNDLAIISKEWEFSSNALKEHTVWKLLYTFSHMLVRQHREEKIQVPESYEIAIMQALEYIHIHYPEKITIKTLCDEVFMSRSTFLRRFCELCRCTPLEYITAYRTKKATEMISKGTMTKSEIAHACGFYDLSHMDRVVKL